jgi:hypothetical protein
MSKFNCTCGHVSSDVQFPTHHEAHLIADYDFDAYTNYAEPATISRDVPTRRVIECAKCGRIWIEPRDGRKYISFVPEGSRLGLVSESMIAWANED